MIIKLIYHMLKQILMLKILYTFGLFGSIGSIGIRVLLHTEFSYWFMSAFTPQNGVQIVKFMLF